MSEPTQAELDNLVATDALFSSPFVRADGRRWFIKKIVAHVKSAAATEVLSKSRTYLEQAKKIASEYQVIQGSHEYWPSDGSYEADARNLLERILYGALGVHPNIFLDHSNPDLLRFIVERRLRSIVQMRYHVNPNGRYFAYPGGGLASMKIRSQAIPYWVGREQWEDFEGTIWQFWPFILSGNGKPVEAVSILFEKTRNNNADINRMDCQSAMMMVVLDSLQTAADPKMLFASLNAMGSSYLTIDNPNGGMRLRAKELDYVGGVASRLTTLALHGSNVDLFVQPLLNIQLSFQPTLDPAKPTPKLSVRVVASTGQHELVTINEAPLPEPDYLITTKAAATATSRLRVDALTIDLPATSRIADEATEPFHFFNDPRSSSALFEYIKLSRNELQIGDVIHLQSHPFHRAKFSFSPWAGERCFIWNP